MQFPYKRWGMRDEVYVLYGKLDSFPVPPNVRVIEYVASEHAVTLALFLEKNHRNVYLMAEMERAHEALEFARSVRSANSTFIKGIYLLNFTPSWCGLVPFGWSQLYDAIVNDPGPIFIQGDVPYIRKLLPGAVCGETITHGFDEEIRTNLI